MDSNNVPLTLKVKRLSENALLPKRASQGSAGYDLFSTKDTCIHGGEKKVINTDIVVEIPEGYYGRIAPRSGLASKKFIDVGAGVIDSDYRGNVGVLLFNLGKDDFEIKKCDRIAQLIIEKIITPEVEEVFDIEDTNRGSGGFGSTGN